MSDFSDSPLAPLSSHMDSLRGVLLKVFLIVGVGMLISFYYADTLIHLSTQSLSVLDQQAEVKYIRHYNTTTTERILPLSDEALLVDSKEAEIHSNLILLKPGGFAEIKYVHNLQKLALFTPLEGFRVALSISLAGGLILTLPFWILPCLQFIFPALKPHEKRLLFPFISASFLFMGLGLALALKITLPLLNNTFYAFNETLGINIWGLESYLDYLIGMLALHASFFELAVLLFFLVYQRILTFPSLKQGRKIVYLASFIIGGLLTPPDIVSQLMVALPLIALYELMLGYAYILKRGVL